MKVSEALAVLELHEYVSTQEWRLMCPSCGKRGSRKGEKPGHWPTCRFAALRAELTARLDSDL